MKCSRLDIPVGEPESHPTRGAWIEILCDVSKLDTKEGSHPTRGAWIEIESFGSVKNAVAVAPHTGCVD